MAPRVAIRDLSLLGVIIGFAVSVPAAELKEARVTQVVKDVKLLPTGAAARPAAVSDEVRNGTAVRTGVDSRSELKFTDQTLARLGANTIFTFTEGTRNLNLQDGAMLLRVPKGAGGAKINSSAVTAAITGTTVMLETHAVTKKNKNSYYKFIVLEGTARLYLPGHLGESTLVKAGQMIIMRPDSKTIPEPVDVDIGKIMQSSLLITGFSAPLGSENLITYQQLKQNEQKSSGQLSETNLVIYGAGTNVVLADPNTVDVAASAGNAAQSPTPAPTPAPTPVPAPGELGPPVVIASPNPYVINSGTVISTDPSITTNGITNLGKIYRGPAIDGPASAWAFGSTSTFDTASGFDAGIKTSGAAFKFTALQLAGNPTISTANGQINLGLIAVDGITSGSPGGPLTFSGIRGLLLATQNGPVDLGSEISFSGLHDLTVYARGANFDLTLSSAISGLTTTTLIAQRDVNIDGTTLDSQALGITAGSNINIGSNAPVSINASDASLLIPNSGTGNISGNATITLNLAGSPAFSGANGLSLTIANNGGGRISQAAEISLHLANLSASSLNLFINNRDGGTIGSSAQVAANVESALTTQGDAAIGITNRNDGPGGGTIRTDAIVSLQANSVSVGGLLDAFVSANGGQIGGMGSLLLRAPGDIHSGGGTLLQVQDDSFNGSGGPLTPGVIGSNALLTVSASNLTSDAFIETDIFNNAGGHIHSNAILTVNTTGDIHAQQDILGTIEDTAFIPNSSGLGGPSHIDGSAAVTLQAQNIITPSTLAGTPGTATVALEASIYSNVQGTVGGDAVVNVIASQNITAPGTALFWVANGNYHNLGPGTIGGNVGVNVSATNISTGNLLAQIQNFGASIGGSALVNLNATTLSVNGSVDAQINNSQSGSIGGNAAINFSVTGTSTVATDAMFQIFGSDGAQSSTISINGGNYTVTGGTFLGNIDGNGTFTLNNVTIAADTVKVGVFGSNGTLRIGGGGGMISANTLLHLYAPGSNGIVDFVSNVTLSSTNSPVAIAANTVTIENGVVVTIAGTTPANVFANVPNYTGSGGNGKTRGVFAGAGATTQPLGGQPPFVTTRAATTKQARSVTSAEGKAPLIHVTDSSELVSLLNNATLRPDGKVRISRHAASRTPSIQGSRRSVAAATDLHRSADASARSGAPAFRLQ
jgi:FecR protein